MALALAVLSNIGCEPFAGGLGGGTPELACGLDLKSGQFYVDLEPGYDINGEPVWGTIINPGDPMMDEPFWIGWSINYFGEPGDSSDESPPFNTRVEIIESGDFHAAGPDTVLWTADVPSEPLDKNEYRTDGILIEDGLPPGDYVVRIILDTENDVWECSGWLPALNNWVTHDLTVLAEPIDDVVVPNGGTPPGTPGGSQLGAQGGRDN